MASSGITHPPVAISSCPFPTSLRMKAHLGWGRDSLLGPGSQRMVGTAHTGLCQPVHPCDVADNQQSPRSPSFPCSPPGLVLAAYLRNPLLCLLTLLIPAVHLALQPTWPCSPPGLAAHLASSQLLVLGTPSVLRGRGPRLLPYAPSIPIPLHTNRPSIPHSCHSSIFLLGSHTIRKAQPTHPGLR